MSGKLILVTGGGRSGKSVFAEKLVRSFGGKCAYMATAQVTDEEMEKRVAKHKARREDDFWVNYEVPLNAHKMFAQIKNVDSILFDCVTIYMSNILYSDANINCTSEVKEQVVFKEMELLLKAARSSGKNVVFVTNELGSGLIPFEPITREFRDLAGLANQLIAQCMDEVYLVVCGMAVNIKDLAVELADGGKK